MIDHLLAIKTAVDAVRNADLAALPAEDLDRFRDHPDSILAFMRDFSVPFNNNLCYAAWPALRKILRWFSPLWG
jgi:hypothetical protein